jgi:hypothetical protein
MLEDRDSPLGIERQSRLQERNAHFKGNADGFRPRDTAACRKLIDDADHPWAERYTDALELFLFHYHTFSGVVRLSQVRVYSAASRLPRVSAMQPGAALWHWFFDALLKP